MNRLGIEFLSVINLPPVEYVNLAADLGCPNISISLGSVPMNPLGYPAFSLLEDKVLRREVKAALADRGVSISLGEGFVVSPGAEARDRAAELEVMYELGVRRINTVSMDPDRHRTFDQFAVTAEMATDAGMEITTEFVPGMTVADLPTALEALRHVARDNFRLLIDTMHLCRSGATAADLRALDPDLIGYVQLCDAPRTPTIPDYMEEAMYHRVPPGAGELPLREILEAVPRDRVVSLEIPQLAEAQGGVGPHDRLRPCVDAARALLDRLTAPA